MRNTLVPQLGQLPRVAGLPFFRVILTGFLISLLVLHLKQYACAIWATSFGFKYKQS